MSEFKREQINLPFPEQFGKLTPISVLLDRGKVSPAEIREQISEYSNNGVRFSFEGVEGNTRITTKGEIIVVVPPKERLGSDVTNIHELIHVEQLLRARANGVTIDDLKDQPAISGVLAELGAREAEIKYIDQLPLLIRLKPNYRSRKREAKESVRMWRNKLPKEVLISNVDTINPYKKIVTIDQ